MQQPKPSDQLSKNDEIRISKLLSFLLRHGAQKAGLSLDSQGYVSTTALLKQPKLSQLSLSTLRHIVDNDQKGRYNLIQTDGEWKIRANQGHSIMLSLDMKRISPVHVVHGTYLKVLEQIRREGLKCMSRTHIHLAHDVSKARGNAEVFVWIDAKKAEADGIVFEESDNGVVLTKGIEGVLGAKYIYKVTDRSGFVIP
jgi:2'-phosphotransferase